MKLYLAGPMRGIPAFNFPAFREARENLREAGYEVFCPAERDEKTGFIPNGFDGNEDLASLGFSLREALGADTAWIAEHADGIALLPNWQNSKGVAAEVALGKALGIYHHPVEYWLEEARMELRETVPPSPTKLSGGTLYFNGIQMGGSFPEWATKNVSSVFTINPGEEEEDVDPATGGKKNVKPERMDLLPVEVLLEDARLYGAGAAKYGDNNWRLGHKFSNHYAALMRHALAWWGGESIDPEMGTSHLAAVRFHAAALMTYEMEDLGTDDRYTGTDDE